MEHKRLLHIARPNKSLPYLFLHKYSVFNILKEY
nr:MAG TPA: hypothetical protein [Caudoviricetes sp.]